MFTYPDKEKSSALILTSIVLFLLLIFGVYFLNSSLTGFKIVQNYSFANQAYYLAEAGINEAIWKLKNDSVWKDDFVDPNKNPAPDGKFWSATFQRDSGLISGGSYEVTIQNYDCARGEIISRAKIEFPSGNFVQRIVKTRVFKALNPSPVNDSPIFSGGIAKKSIFILTSTMNIHNGNIFSNGDINLVGRSVLNVEGQVLAVGEIKKSSASTIKASARCSQNFCDDGCGGACPPEAIDVPMIDFDSEDLNSYKNKAIREGTLYSSSEFETMLWENPDLVLNNDVTYVTGPIELKGGQKLTVNGVLVSDSYISVGEKYNWGRRSGNSQIIVNNISGKPSGILAKGKIKIGPFSRAIDINGLLYASDEFILLSFFYDFNLTGGLITNKLTLINFFGEFNITLNDQVIRDTIGVPQYSPVVTIEHWEESY